MNYQFTPNATNSEIERTMILCVHLWSNPDASCLVLFGFDPETSVSEFSFIQFTLKKFSLA